MVEFKYPLVVSAFDSVTFRYLNPRQQETKGKFTVTQDSLNLRKYVIRPTEKFLPGYEYFLNIPGRKFKDINGFYNDSLEVKVTLPNDETLSLLSINMSNVKNKYIVDLLDEKRLIRPHIHGIQNRKCERPVGFESPVLPLAFHE